MIGSRKLLAWFAVFLLVAGATYFQKDIPPGARDLLTAVTMAFFVTNAAGKFGKSGLPS